jgi:hypothetical protein
MYSRHTADRRGRPRQGEYSPAQIAAIVRHRRHCDHQKVQMARWIMLIRLDLITITLALAFAIVLSTIAHARTSQLVLAPHRRAIQEP